MTPPKKKGDGPLTASFITGAIALVFLIIGYEVAVFVHKAAVTRLVANRDQPDTVFVYADGPSAPGVEDATLVAKKRADAPAGASPSPTASRSVRHNAAHSPEAVRVREKAAPRPVESFRFNPNTVSIEDLQRLGFSEKQAQSIDNYRQKGGRFRRKADFAKSYVVADSVYERLAPFIDIPRLDINKADSVALLDLPGIGPYFAGKVVQYRTKLGGYSTVEQLTEIYHFDSEKLDGMRDLIYCSKPAPFSIWTLPEADLAKHPHLSRAEAHSIVLYREHHTAAECTLEGLRQAGILSEEHYTGLSRCLLAAASSTND
ncbi:MAG: helix-hairpin-helix domain-containing protein [Bacteroidales bacterium]|nr:helix-hairpin-helix domain-containing protein [Bacteroidales bacterium]